MKPYLLHCSFSLLLCLFLLAPAHADCLYGNYYVKSTATGTGDGSSWTNAFTDLQAAIDVAVKGDVICVAAGTYLPTHRHDGDSLRHSTFYIDKDITLLGGFSGEPGTEGTLAGRDPKVNETILSGDLGVQGDTIDNAFHVVFIDHVTDTMRLDGFIITGGNNFGGAGLETYGAGMYIDAEAGLCSPVIANCTIHDNHSDQGGGGITVYAEFTGMSKPSFLNCHIIRNVAGGGGGMQGLVDGGGMLCPTLSGCFFQGNTARTAQGSAISLIVHSSTSVAQMINCVVTGNHAPFSSAFEIFLTGTGQAQPNIINSVFSGNNNGSLRVSSIGTEMSNVEVRNSIFCNNGFGHGLKTNNADANVTNSIMENGFFGDGNLSMDPLFVEQPSAQGTPHTDGDVHLQPGSPAIDAGDNGAMPEDILVDADGLPRFVDVSSGNPGGVIDIGAFEYQQAITSTTPVFKNMDWGIYPNPAISAITITLPQSEANYECSLWSSGGTKLLQQEAAAGSKAIDFRTAHLPAGVYYVSMTTNHLTDIRKLIIQH